MKTYNLLQKITIFTLLVLFRLAASGQVQINGTVYERSARYGMEGVSVRSTTGAGTITDSLGHYSIRLPLSDSISFSYQGKATQKFPVKDIPINRPFDMSLHVDIKVLPTVVVQQRSYHLDSLENREEYKKVFNYEPEYIASGNGGVGINLDALFSIRKIKRMENFRRYMEQLERDKYVDHRFNKGLVKKITGLQPPALDTFMVEYRPSYETLQGFETEYQYLEYIKESGKYFSQTWRREHPAQP
ncbi:hypothetical protein SAMN05518672_101756 [Chitinophaga sp. CF118]|uniref:hypothetical protein n=1 Tax=Chitinophaga sp. CF118 TaxID=1884367 RepID=UPI0008E6951D|nr:hypothetical protein [Chitinophaga sp. CF118]SFD15138.1 hypothetical protein SAMN05518672_101756 [Chitinophaga sp. CF118]